MGNANSSHAEPQPAVSSDGGESDVGPAPGPGGGGMFRLPLYRGERDAFVPIDDNEIEGAEPQRRKSSRGPPVLAVDPKLSTGADEFVSPLHANGAASPPAEGTQAPFFCPVSGAAERPADISPPSVISSSDSSYVSCYSSIIAPNGEGTSNQRTSIRNRQRSNAVPAPIPRPVPKRNGSDLKESGVFDCVKRPAAPPPPQPLQRKIPSSGSLSSLFETCLRSDDDENEYEEDSDLASHYSRGTFNRSCSGSSRGFQRSCSVGSQYSQGSAYSNHSHNSYHLTSNAASRTSLASAFSSATQLSYYTDEEKNMADGDEPTDESDLRRIRNYHVVTTAALPWMTGTAVNPLLRAAYLLRRNGELREKTETSGEQSVEQKEKEGVDEGDSPAGMEMSPGSKSEESRSETAKPPTKTKRRTGPEARSPIEEIDAPGNDRAGARDEDDCSLDYSCFSFSEIDAPNPNANRELVSPLGEEDDSLLLSPFTPFEPGTKTTQMEGATPNEGGSNREIEGTVTLVLPWLKDAADRNMLYGSNASFDNQGEQEAYIRSWLAKEAGMPAEATELDILFYPARYHKKYSSIFAALGDICDLIPDESADVCILEEPEHLNWYRAPGCESWSVKFRHCVGVIHTNYKAYARNHARAGFLAAPLLAGVNSLVVQANCHRVVKLSGVLQEFVPTSECVENVHGIRETYLEEGRRRRMATASGREGRKAYFIGKLLWAKGFDQLLELQACFRERTGSYFAVDIFGSGPDESEIKRAFHGNEGEKESILNGLWSTGGRRQRLPARFMGRVDHSELAGDEYSIFVNPSLTEVLCTTTAEAIAMGKWVVIPSHPSNAFFAQFPNCLQYRNRREFTSKLKQALNNDPPHLMEALASVLSWEAATMRCLSAAAISKRDAAREHRMRQAKLTRKISGMWNGSKSDLKAMGVSPETGYGSVPLLSP